MRNPVARWITLPSGTRTETHVGVGRDEVDEDVRRVDGWVLQQLHDPHAQVHARLLDAVREAQVEHARRAGRHGPAEDHLQLSRHPHRLFQSPRPPPCHSHRHPPAARGAGSCRSAGRPSSYCIRPAAPSRRRPAKERRRVTTRTPSASAAPAQGRTAVSGCGSTPKPVMSTLSVAIESTPGRGRPWRQQARRHQRLGQRVSEPARQWAAA
jgi:hypothetical protein